MAPKCSTKEYLKKYLSTLKKFKKVEITLLKSRFNRSVYFLQIKNETYVARVAKATNDGGSSMENETLILRFLNSKKIDFVPKIIKYNKKLNISIESYIPGNHLNFKAVTEKEIRIFAQQLATIHALPLKEFYSFCKKRNYTQLKPESSKDFIKIYGIDRFLVVKTTCPDKKVISWIEKCLQENIHYVEKQTKKSSNHLLWGCVGDNILVCAGKLFFIDFEFSRVASSYELADTKVLGHFPKSVFNKIVRAYSLASGVSEDILYEEIKYEEKINRLHDIIWAAMKWGEYKNTMEEKKYKDLTFKRMKLFEKIK